MAVAELQPTAAAASAGLGGTFGPRRAPRWSAGTASAVHAAVGTTPGEVSAISGAAPRSLWFLGLGEGVEVEHLKYLKQKVQSLEVQSLLCVLTGIIRSNVVSNYLKHFLRI